MCSHSLKAPLLPSHSSTSPCSPQTPSNKWVQGIQKRPLHQWPAAASPPSRALLSSRCRRSISSFCSCAVCRSPCCSACMSARKRLSDGSACGTPTQRSCGSDSSVHCLQGKGDRQGGYTRQVEREAGEGSALACRTQATRVVVHTRMRSRAAP